MTRFKFLAGFAVALTAGVLVAATGGANRFINGTEIPFQKTLVYTSGSQAVTLGALTGTSATLSSTLAVTGASTLTGVVTASTGATVAGNVAVGGTLAVTGASTFVGASTFTLPNIYGVATGLTAHAGGGQGSCLALTKELNIVSTVATAADSVCLPTAAAGNRVTVVNTATNPMAVFPASGGTIQPVAANASITVPGLSAMTFNGTSTTVWVQHNSVPSYTSIATGLTAHAGGTQGAALALTAMVNEVTTVGTAADSVALPVPVPGQTMVVSNSAAANSMQIFAVSPATINGVATGTGVALAAAKSAYCIAITTAKWICDL